MVKRRKLVADAAAVAAGGVAVAASSFPKPAIAQSMPEVKWRCTSSFPKSLDTIYGAAEKFSKAVSEATDGKFQIQVFAAGEIVPGLQAADAVANGTVESCHTAAYYYVGKDPAFAVGATIPFGPNQRQLYSWLKSAGGDALFDEFLKTQGLKGMLCGSTGCQMGGWFRKEIKTLQDLNGLKMRIAGLAGQIMQKLGVVPQQIAGGDIYPALEKGTIDAAEWIGPYDDYKLGFYKVAPYYYYPGWWEGGLNLHLMFNPAKWEELPATYKAIVAQAADHATLLTQAEYDKRNPDAIKRLIAEGAQLRPFPLDTIDAAYRAANEVYAGISAQNAQFKKLYDSLMSFRNDEYLWWQVAEFTYDSLLIRATRAQQAQQGQKQ